MDPSLQRYWTTGSECSPLEIWSNSCPNPTTTPCRRSSNTSEGEKSHLCYFNTLPFTHQHKMDNMWLIVLFFQGNWARGGEPNDVSEHSHRVRSHAAAARDGVLQHGFQHGLPEPDRGAHTAGVWEHFWQVDVGGTSFVCLFSWVICMQSSSWSTTLLKK